MTVTREELQWTGVSRMDESRNFSARHHKTRVGLPSILFTKSCGHFAGAFFYGPTRTLPSTLLNIDFRPKVRSLVTISQAARLHLLTVLLFKQFTLEPSKCHPQSTSLPQDGHADIHDCRPSFGCLLEAHASSSESYEVRLSDTSIRCRIRN